MEYILLSVHSDGKDGNHVCNCQSGGALKQISPEAEIGIGEDTGFDIELVMFIPTETVQPLDALRLLFLMNEYALSDPPDKVEWDNNQLIAFAQRYLPESDVRTEMIVQMEK